MASKDKDKEPKPELPPSKIREDMDPRAKTSRATVARRKGAEVIREKKKGKGKE